MSFHSRMSHQTDEQFPIHSQNVTISNCRPGTPPTKPEPATFFGSPTTVDLFSFHCDNSWRRVTLRLLNANTQKIALIDRNRHQVDTEGKDLSASDNRAASDHSEKRPDLLDSITEDLLVQIIDLIDVKCAVTVLGKSCRRTRALVR